MLPDERHLSVFIAAAKEPSFFPILDCILVDRTELDKFAKFVVLPV